MIPEEKPYEPSNPNLGHNQPPNPKDMVLASINDLKDRFKERRDEILASLARNMDVVDRFAAGKAADVISISRNVRATLEDQRKEITDPYREAALVGKSTIEGFWSEVDDKISLLLERIDAFTQEEDKRIAAQQLEQEQFMARMRGEAPAPEPKAVDSAPENKPAGREAIDYSKPAEPAPAAPQANSLRAPKAKKIRGDYGGTISRTEEAVWTITDMRALPDFILQSEPVMEAALKVVKSMGRHNPNIPGAVRGTSEKLSVK